jgi:hypothetical protein
MSWWQARSPRAFAAAAATAWIALLGACSTSPADLGDATLADAALAAQDGSVEAADTSVPSPDAAAPSPDAGLEAAGHGRVRARRRVARRRCRDRRSRRRARGSAEPRPGGGVTDRFIRGVLHVHVIDEQTETPVAGALVQLGGGAATSEPSATTDASGRSRSKASASTGRRRSPRPRSGMRPRPGSAWMASTSRSRCASRPRGPRRAPRSAGR